MMSKKTYRTAIILITALFFLWAFLHNINPILIPHLKKACTLSDTQSAFIDLSVYLAYFIAAVPAGLFMHKFGFKKGIIFGLIFYAIGAFLFIPAASMRSYPFFLFALFIIATGATFLETGANPFITILGDSKTSAQRLNFAQSFNGLGAFAAPIVGGRFILSGIEHLSGDLKGMSAEQVSQYLQSEADTIKLPYLVIGILVVILIILFLITPIPDGSDEETVSDHHVPAAFSIKVLRHVHLRWAVVTQFFYVGAQVGVGSFFIRYAKFVAGVPEKHAAFLWGALAMVGFMAGRFLGTFLMRYVKPARLLSLYAAINIILLFIAVNTKGQIALNTIIAVPFFMSIMYPTIFALGISGLGEETKIAASFLVMAIVGGAVTPVVMGIISDKTDSIQTAYYVPLICFCFVLLYGLQKHKNKKQPNLNYSL